jgi:hypothetical protein
LVNIILAACDGKEGNPGEYRDYQFKRERPPTLRPQQNEKIASVSRG